MHPELQRDLMVALERPHRLGTIGGDLEEQLAHCASFSSVLAQMRPGTPPTRGIDLGTGGGLPGIALAALWPDTQWTLVDVRAARADEVERTVLRLGMADQVSVIAAEAQMLGHDEDHREQYDVVVARAFGPASITAECAAGVVKVGGIVIISEPPQPEPDRWNVAGLEELGFGGAEPAGDDRQFVVLPKRSLTPPRIPRLPAKANRGWL